MSCRVQTGLAMGARIILRPSLPFPACLFPTRFLPTPFALIRPATLFLISTTAISQSLPYGPSLHKGQKPTQNPSTRPKLPSQQSVDQDNDALVLDTDSFTRTFDVSALRVPSDQCFALENRLRGHLLNWPRIRNIARVPGDEIEDEFTKILEHKTDSSSDGNESESNKLMSLERRIYGKAEKDGEELSPVLYRDKLAKTFNSKGYVNFRNLAKMSRPKKKREKRDEIGEEKKGIGKNDMCLVEVIEESENDDDDEDLSGLLGDEFKGRKWKGSTRLLLLDERYANRGVEEMPEAIKVFVATN